MEGVVLDTSVAIDLRDGQASTIRRLESLDGPFLLSVISRVELEGGVHRDRDLVEVRRRRLDELLLSLTVLPFDDACADAYRSIVEARQFSRRKIVDRMIAAQALVHRATLITLNGADFADVPGLVFEAW